MIDLALLQPVERQLTERMRGHTQRGIERERETQTYTHTRTGVYTGACKENTVTENGILGRALVHLHTGDLFSGRSMSHWSTCFGAFSSWEARNTSFSPMFIVFVKCHV